MWVAIFGTVIIMAIGAVAYLCNRVYRFADVGKKIALRANRRLRMFQSVIGVLVAIDLLCIAVGYVNAVIITWSCFGCCPTCCSLLSKKCGALAFRIILRARLPL